MHFIEFFYYSDFYQTYYYHQQNEKCFTFRVLLALKFKQWLLSRSFYFLIRKSLKTYNCNISRQFLVIGCVKFSEIIMNASSFICFGSLMAFHLKIYYYFRIFQVIASMWSKRRLDSVSMMMVEQLTLDTVIHIFPFPPFLVSSSNFQPMPTN